jgi:hypothetical protein
MMKYIRFLSLLFLCSSLLHGEGMNSPKLDLYPDTVILIDGTTFHGLIVRNDEVMVTLQQKMGEKDIPKKFIRRIIDERHQQAYFAELVDPGKLPPWRMVVQDLRSDDNIHLFREVPATAITSGYLKNIPYLSFRINKRVEMNVYGNPENPVCLEFGVYEKNPEEITKFKKIIRAFLAGILSSREEVGALYALPETGGDIRVKQVALKVLPPTAPDAYHGWWLSVYRPDALASARISDVNYAKVTVPFDSVDLRTGDLRSDALKQHGPMAVLSSWNFDSMIPGLQGFYRDKMGELKPLLGLPTARPATSQ